MAIWNNAKLSPRPSGQRVQGEEASGKCSRESQSFTPPIEAPQKLNPTQQKFFHLRFSSISPRALRRLTSECTFL